MEKKVYESKSDKVIDFLIGFFILPVFFAITTGSLSSAVGYNNSGRLIVLFVQVAEIVGAIYLCRKRKFIGIGLLFVLIVAPLVLFGTCLIMRGGRSI